RALLTRCERRLGVRAGGTADDASVTLEELDCAFACAVGPVIEIDHVRRGRVSLDDVEPLLAAPTKAAPLPLPDIRVAPPSIRAAERPAVRFALLRREAERRRTGRRLAVGL